MSIKLFRLKTITFVSMLIVPFIFLTGLIGCTANDNSYVFTPPPSDASKTDFEIDNLGKPSLYTYFLDDTASQVVPLFDKDFDLIISIDDSGSMDPFINGVYDNIWIFINGLKSKNIKFRISFVANNTTSKAAPLSQWQDPTPAGPYLLTESTDLDLEMKIKANLRAFTGGSGNEQPVTSLIYASSSTYFKRYFFRPNKAKIFITLSDAVDTGFDDSDATVLDIKKKITDSVGKSWRYFAIGIVDNDCQTSEFKSLLIRKLTVATGGQTWDICEPDYSKHMITAVDEIDSFLSSLAFIEHREFDQVDVSQVKSNGILIPPALYRINAENELEFDHAAKPAPGTHVDIDYTLTYHKDDLSNYPPLTRPNLNLFFTPSCERTALTKRAVDLGSVEHFAPFPVAEAPQLWKLSEGLPLVSYKTAVYDPNAGQKITSSDGQGRFLNLFEDVGRRLVLIFFRTSDGFEVFKLDLLNHNIELLLAERFEFAHKDFKIRSSLIDVVSTRAPTSFLFLSNFHYLKVSLADLLQKAWNPQTVPFIESYKFPYDASEATSVLPSSNTSVQTLGRAYWGRFTDFFHLNVATMVFRVGNTLSYDRIRIFNHHLATDPTISHVPPEMVRQAKAGLDERITLLPASTAFGIKPSFYAQDLQNFAQRYTWDIDSFGHVGLWRDSVRACYLAEEDNQAFVAKVVVGPTVTNHQLWVLSKTGQLKEYEYEFRK